MKETLTEFLSYLSSERGHSTHTIEAYQKDLEQFETFCNVQGWEALHLSPAQIRKYLGHLAKQEKAPRSIARKLSSLRQFYRFLLREDVTQEDPTEVVTYLVKAKRLPKTLTEAEITALIESATGETEWSIRDRAILEVWYATGARISELAGLLASKVDFAESVVRFKGKGGRERIVPLYASALDWCLKYRDVRHEWLRRAGLKETKAFFLSNRSAAFSRQGLYGLLRRYTKKAGLTKKVWPHMIRHTFATHVLQGGADLRAVQELLGHRSIATTEIYTHLDIENLKVMQLKYHPRD